MSEGETLEKYFKLVSEHFEEEEKAIWTPGWWYLTIEKAVEMMKEEALATDIFHLQNLKTLIQKVTRLWSNCYQKWEITSLESFYQKTGPSLASTFKTLLPSMMIENVIFSIVIYLNKESLSKEICTDSALMTIMSTSSIPALLAVPSVSAVGEKRSHAEQSNQDIDSDQTSESGDETTLSMQSFISFTKNGVEKKRGLTEEVKDLRISLKVYDGEMWKRLSGEYYDHPIHKLDLTFNRSTLMMTSLNQFIKDANEHMNSLKGVKKIRNPRNLSGRSSRGKYNNFWKTRRFAP
jgi:hypothetical protein